MCMREHSQGTWVTLHPLPTSTLSEVKARLGHEKKIYALKLICSKILQPESESLPWPLILKTGTRSL